MNRREPAGINPSGVRSERSGSTRTARASISSFTINCPFRAASSAPKSKREPLPRLLRSQKPTNKDLWAPAKAGAFPKGFSPMPDGNQGHFTYRPPQSETSPQAFNFPGATNPAGGVQRALAFLRGLSGKAVV